MVEIIESPGIVQDIQYPPKRNDEASFRILTHYNPETDESMLRFDIKFGERQFQANLFGGPAVVISGAKIRADDPLLVPRTGFAKGTSIIADRLELAEVLEGFAKRLRDG